MTSLALALLAVPLGFFAYSYLIYPLVLRVVSLARPSPRRWGAPLVWPTVTVTIPCYNEGQAIGATIESLLALGYPPERLQILIISDGSTDDTDAIVESYADRGVELLRLESRGGKTAAENAAVARVRGEIVVNTDATIRIVPGALHELIAVFQDPTIGVASGRDISVGDVRSAGNQGESGYVGYEMWIRSLETRVGSIVGASGCFFASRRPLYDSAFPEALSRDFASCLIAREQGFRSVSVDAARALVPRAPTIRAEYRRKVRTMARGLGTLQHKRALLNPAKYGGFALMLISHKLCRWLFQLTLPLLAGGAALLAIDRAAVAPWILSGAVLLVGIGAVAWKWPESRPMPRVISSPGYFIWSNVAGFLAWVQFFRGRYQPIWEPTRRPGIQPVK